MKFSDGISAQPQALVASAAAIAPQIRELPGLGGDEVVGLVGIGGNGHAASGAANAWRARGLRAVALSAGELVHERSHVAATYVVLSESGRSTETLEALDLIGPARTIALTNDANSPVAQACTEYLLLGSGPDSAVYTTGFTATLQALALLGAHWADGPAVAASWARIPEIVGDLLDRDGLVQQAAQALDAAAIVDVVGSGVSLASSGEGALLLREAARLRTAHFETHAYLHGPMETLDPDVACVIVGSGRETRLARDVSKIGCATVRIGVGAVSPDNGNGHAFAVPAVTDPLAAALLETVVIQQLGSAVALRRGLAVDGFRHHQDDTKVARP